MREDACVCFCLKGLVQAEAVTVAGTYDAHVGPQHMLTSTLTVALSAGGGACRPGARQQGGGA